MSLLRTMVSALVAAAIVFAPMASAWASVAGAAKEAGAIVHWEAAGHGSDFALAPTEDCASKVKSAAASDDTPCCNKDNVCPPEFCMAKCFHLYGLEQQSQLLTSLSRSQLRSTKREPAFSWSDQPLPRPPRT